MSAAADVRDDDAGPEVSQAVALLEAVITSYRRGRPTDRPSPQPPSKRAQNPLAPRDTPRQFEA
jgi:hypothetical protein